MVTYDSNRPNYNHQHSHSAKSRVQFLGVRVSRQAPFRFATHVLVHRCGVRRRLRGGIGNSQRLDDQRGSTFSVRQSRSMPSLGHYRLLRPASSVVLLHPGIAAVHAPMRQNSHLSVWRVSNASGPCLLARHSCLRASPARRLDRHRNGGHGNCALDDAGGYSIALASRKPRPTNGNCWRRQGH